MELHASGKGFSCTKCPKVYQTEEGYLNHVESHNKQIFKCAYCDSFTSYRREDVEKHWLFMHKDSYSKDAEYDGNLVEYHCSICFKPYNRKAMFYRHMNTHTEEERKSLGENVPAFSIKETKPDNNRRRNAKDYFIRCEECNLGFVTKRSHEQHCISKHGLVKYTCHICGKNLSGSHVLKLHVLRHSWQSQLLKDQKPATK